MLSMEFGVKCAWVCRTICSKRPCGFSLGVYSGSLRPMRIQGPFDHPGCPALTVTLCPHFRLTDNLWFRMVLRGAKGAAVSKGLVARNCHHMLQNAAIICVKSHRLSLQA
jgi:hypothetical protein